MDTSEALKMPLNALDSQMRKARSSFLAELLRLSYQAKSAAGQRFGPLPTLAWLETSVARLREMHKSLEKAERAREMLRRVCEAEELDGERMKDLATKKY